MKNINFFPHDYNARNDKKLVNLNMLGGLEFIGLYWCLIELMYESENGRIYSSECERIAFELRTQCDKIFSVLHTDLFIFENDYFISTSQQKRAEIINKKKAANAAAARVRWGSDANAKQTQSKRKANVRNKVNNIIKQNKEIIT